MLVGNDTIFSGEDRDTTHGADDVLSDWTNIVSCKEEGRGDSADKDKKDEVNGTIAEVVRHNIPRLVEKGRLQKILTKEAPHVKGIGRAQLFE